MPTIIGETFLVSRSVHFSLHFFIASSLSFFFSYSFLSLSEGLSMCLEAAVVGLELSTSVILGFLFQSEAV